MAKKVAAKKTTAKKAAVKTQKNKGSIAEFIAAVDDDARRADAKANDKMLREVTGEKPALWGRPSSAMAHTNSRTRWARRIGRR